VISAVDTNVLLDVFRSDPRYLSTSLAALHEAVAEGHLVACEVVWSEITAAFPSPEAAREALDSIPLQFSPLTMEAALKAGTHHAAYRRRGGARDRMVADFLIGAHAQLQADRLLTRDRGFYRAYFQDLTVLDPAMQ